MDLWNSLQKVHTRTPYVLVNAFLTLHSNGFYTYFVYTCMHTLL